MTPKYLYPRQRQIEVMSAIHVGGLGFYIHFSDILTGRTPVAWMGLNHSGQIALGTLLIASALVWAIGIHINGSRWWSPFLRLAAIAIDLAVAIFAAWQGGGSSATYTYAWVTVFMAVGAVNASRDSLTAFRRQELWTI